MVQPWLKQTSWLQAWWWISWMWQTLLMDAVKVIGDELCRELEECRSVGGQRKWLMKKGLVEKRGSDKQTCRPRLIKSGDMSDQQLSAPFSR